jgi:basic membrane protein A and related proteins
VKIRLLTLLALVAALALAAGKSAPGAAPLKVGYVVGAGYEPDPTNLFGLPYAGFIRGVRALHLQGRVVQVAPNQDATGALSLLARQRYDLVIVGTPAGGSVVAVARRFPKTKFVVPDISRGELPNPPKNIQGTVFRDEEAGYLAGYLAALMEKRRPGPDVIGAVGGMQVPGVDRWIVGYRAGAKHADPAIRVLTTYADNFSNPTKCHTIALDQIAKGAGALFNVAGGCGFGTLEAAKEKGVWGIGVDIDQSFLGRHILTSAVARLDVRVRDAMDRLKRGTFTTGSDTVFDLHNGGVGLATISPAVPRSVLSRLDAVRRQIIAGRVKVPRVT